MVKTMSETLGMVLIKYRTAPCYLCRFYYLHLLCRYFRICKGDAIEAQRLELGKLLNVAQYECPQFQLDLG